MYLVRRDPPAVQGGVAAPDPPPKPSLTVQQVCERLSLKRPKAVLDLIHSGALHATNISQGKRRPTWRIAEEDLAAFRKGREEK